MLGAAADRAVASWHADHRTDELQAQRRVVPTTKDAISIGGRLGRGARVVSYGRGGDAQALRVFAVHGGARKRLGRRAAHHALRRRSGAAPRLVPELRVRAHLRQMRSRTSGSKGALES